MTIRIENVATDGVDYLEDIRAIERKYGLLSIFSYSEEYLDFELYGSLKEEAIFSFSLAIIAIMLVILVLTTSLLVTILIVISVFLVNLFLMGSLYFWGIDFSLIVFVNIVISTGLAVDYSAHIGHTYLVIECPPELTTNSAKRKYKASMALSKMGSSVFHGGFSTLIAICVLGMAKSFIFTIFFKLWLGIIIFGITNGFIFVPVMLSMIGPISKPRIESQGGPES